jgi:hypothetical protein
MLKNKTRAVPPGGTRDTDGSAAILQARGAEAARRLFRANVAAENIALRQSEHDQLARDIEAIERAAAASRQADPVGETLMTPPTARFAPSRSVWWLIGLLWVAMALLTTGALVAIAMLAG